MKELKDYLHLYGINSPIHTIDGEGTVMAIYAKAVQVSLNTIFPQQELHGFDKGNGGLHRSYLYKDSYCQLILRPLSDMTEDEWQNIEDLSSVMADAYGYNGIKDNFLIDTTSVRFSWKIVNETLIELRKLGIDCDGLIESDLAINKSTIKTTII